MKNLNLIKFLFAFVLFGALITSCSKDEDETLLKSKQITVESDFIVDLQSSIKADLVTSDSENFNRKVRISSSELIKGRRDYTLKTHWSNGFLSTSKINQSTIQNFSGRTVSCTTDGCLFDGCSPQRTGCTSCVGTCTQTITDTF